MRKGELVASVVSKTNVSRSVAEAVINATLATIIDSVAAGDQITITGFGSFESRDRQARVGRNPQNGQPIQIPASRAPAFRPGRPFTDAVKGNK